MTPESGDWVTLDIAGSGIRLRYPVVSPEGQAIDVDQLRVHARTRGSREIYFEVSKEHGVTARQRYDRERQALERAPVAPQISELTPTTAAGREAYRFTATWPDRERVFTLIEKGGVLYRTVHDPGSPINEQIVATLELE